MNLETKGYIDKGEGKIELKGEAQELKESLIQFLISELDDGKTEIIEGSSTITREILEKTAYLKNFPHQLIKTEKGYRTPAACLQLYEKVKDPEKRYIIICNCGRAEAGNYEFPNKISDFHMLELVVFEREDNIHETRVKLEKKAKEIMTKLGLAGEFKNATDSFYMETNEGARIIQQLKQLKREFIHENTPLLSINYHEDHFTSKFGISGRHSICMAFGIERIIAAKLQ